MRVVVSGVNPTDWKVRRGNGEPMAYPETVPNQDGAGVIDAVGEGVDPARVGERVWLWETAWRRPGGSAQEAVVVPQAHAAALPESASFELGASIGIPALTAHRCLTVGQTGPARLTPGALSGAVVLVAGGAGAVGHAAIELARWAGADVLATVSGEHKAALARSAGARAAVDYRIADAVEQIRAHAPAGVDVIVEVAAGVNAALDRDVLAPGGTVAAYAGTAGSALTLDVRALMVANVRYQFVLVYTVSDQVKLHALSDVSAALAAGALAVGEQAGLPLHRFGLEQTAAAHDAVEAGAVGKVLIDVAASGSSG